MNAYRHGLSFATLLLTLFLNPPCGSAAQETHRQKPEQPQQQNQYRDQAQSMQQDSRQSETQSFPGKITEKHGKFYLQPDFHSNAFELSDAWAARRLVGKKVRVTGVLDPERNMLRVIAITKIP